MKILINTIIGIVFYSVFSFSVSASVIANVPLRQAWSLATDDVISVNRSLGTATGRVYLSNAEGVIYRATATTTSARLLSVTEGAITGGRLNPYLTAALLAGGLSYEAYQWYKSTESKSIVPVGYCDGRTSWGEMTSGACSARIQQYFDTEFFVSYPYHVTTLTNTYELNSGKKYQFVFHHEYKNTSTGSLWTQNQNYYWNYTRDIEMASTDKEKVDSSVAEAALLNALSTAPSSRAAFGENSQPYPLDGLFTNEDLAVDPTYSPQANITTDNIKDYITKYNNGLLQSTNPAADNYVTPAQLAYIKAQAEAAAATAAGGSAATNPLANIEQPITQAQYDESNKKYATEQAAALNTALAPLTATMTQFNADKQEMIGKIGSPTAPPAAMPNIFNWVWPTGTCNGFTVNLNIHVPVIGSLTLNKKFDEYCVPYQEYIHPAFFWFFNLITALYIFRLWDRTAVDVAKI